MPGKYDHIPDEKWDEAADAVIHEVRVESGIIDWLPTLLNGSQEFERRVLAKLKKSRSRVTHRSKSSAIKPHPGSRC